MPWEPNGNLGANLALQSAQESRQNVFLNLRVRWR